MMFRSRNILIQIYFFIIVAVLICIFFGVLYINKTDSKKEFVNKYVTLNQKEQLSLEAKIEEAINNTQFLSEITGEAIGYGGSNISKFTKKMLENNFINFLLNADDYSLVQFWSLSGENLANAHIYENITYTPQIQQIYQGEYELDGIYISDLRIDTSSASLSAVYEIITDVENKYGETVGFIQIRCDVSYLVKNIAILLDFTGYTEVLTQDGTFVYSDKDIDLALYGVTFKEIYGNKLWEKIKNQECNYFFTEDEVIFASFAENKTFKNDEKIIRIPENTLTLLKVDIEEYKGYIGVKNITIISIIVFILIVSSAGAHFIAKYRQNKKRVKALILKQASEDPLTGLYNRRYFYEKCSDFLKNEKNDTFSILFIDLDKFKPINDTYGHEVGDVFLIEISNILRKVFNKNAVIARFGGDEFCILLKTKDKETIETMSKQVLKEIEKPIVIEERTHSVSASMGIVIYDDKTISMDEMIRIADKMMYNAKQTGGKKYEMVK